MLSLCCLQNSNIILMLIFSLIEHELSELCEFYKLYPKMVIFHAVPSVLQMAVTNAVLEDLLDSW